MDVGEDIVGVLQVEKCDVSHLLLQELALRRRYPLGHPAEEEVGDGDIVGRQIVNDVDVPAHGTEVGADEIEVSEVAAASLADQVLYRHDSRVIDEDVSHHQRHALHVRELAHFHGFMGVHRDRLLAQDVLACEDGSPYKVVMGGRGGRNDDRIDLGGGDQSLCAGEQLDVGSDEFQPLQSSGVGIRNGNEFAARKLLDLANVIRSPTTVTCDTNPQIGHLHTPSSAQCLCIRFCGRDHEIALHEIPVTRRTQRPHGPSLHLLSA